jgi:hypothetical protein
LFFDGHYCFVRPRKWALNYPNASDYFRFVFEQEAHPCEWPPIKVAHYLDLLWLEAQDVRGLELIGRRRMLQKALRKAEDALRFSEHLSLPRARPCTATPAPWA